MIKCQKVKLHYYTTLAAVTFFELCNNLLDFSTVGKHFEIIYDYIIIYEI